MTHVLFLRSGKDDSYEKLASDAGFKCFSFSPIEFVFTVESLQVQLAEHLTRYSGIVFTSPRAIQAFSSVLNETGFSPANYSKPVFVVGKATGKAARNLGFSQILGENSGDATRLAPVIAEYPFTTTRAELLFPGATKLIGGLEKLLIPHNIALHIIPVYKTLARTENDLRGEIDSINEEIDVVVYFSPSGIDSVHSLVSERWPNIQTIAIGNTTGSCLTNSYIAKSPNPEGILDCLLRNFRNSSSVVHL